MRKVLVVVHGAGKQLSDYYKEPLAGITHILGVPPTTVSVYYADLMNLGAPVGITAPAPVDTDTSPLTLSAPPVMAMEAAVVTRFKLAFAMQTQADLMGQPASERMTALFALPGQSVAELLATELNEITGYLFNPNAYNAIQKRMRDGLDQAAQNGDAIVIASHSLGTVVAFDALHAVGAKYNVSTFFTMGSPLAKLRRLGSRGSDLGQITSDHVKEWLNLYDTTDPIANALGPAFPLPGYRLRDVFIDVATDPIPSHDYLRNAETFAALAAALR